MDRKLNELDSVCREEGQNMALSEPGVLHKVQGDASEEKKRKNHRFYVVSKCIFQTVYKD